MRCGKVRRCANGSSLALFTSSTDQASRVPSSAFFDDEATLSAPFAADDAGSAAAAPDPASAGAGAGGGADGSSPDVEDGDSGDGDEGGREDDAAEPDEAAGEDSASAVAGEVRSSKLPKGERAWMRKYNAKLEAAGMYTGKRAGALAAVRVDEDLEGGWRCSSCGFENLAASEFAQEGLAHLVVDGSDTWGDDELVDGTDARSHRLRMLDTALNRDVERVRVQADGMMRGRTVLSLSTYSRYMQRNANVHTHSLTHTHARTCAHGFTRARTLRRRTQLVPARKRSSFRC